MPVQLLPASAAAFAPRASSVNVVLSSKVEPWLTQTLKRVNRTKRPLNNVSQHQRCLTETLSSKDAIWTLASMLVAKFPEANMPADESERLYSCYDMLHVEAYIVHVDMVLRNEVAYKLTIDTIDILVKYHKEIYCPDAKASTAEWSGKDKQLTKLHDDFVQAVNKFVYRAHVSALEGLEEGGAGELLCGRSEEVKAALNAMLKPLVPPPPRVEVIRQPPQLLPCTSPIANNNMWVQSPIGLPTVDAWHVLPSSPSVTSTSVDSSPIWVAMNMAELHMPSPPDTSMMMPHTTGPIYYSTAQVTAPIPAMPLPSMYASTQCGISVGMMPPGFEWQRYQDFGTPIIM